MHKFGQSNLTTFDKVKMNHVVDVSYMNMILLLNNVYNIIWIHFDQFISNRQICQSLNLFYHHIHMVTKSRTGIQVTLGPIQNIPVCHM